MCLCVTGSSQLLSSLLDRVPVYISTLHQGDSYFLHRSTDWMYNVLMKGEKAVLRFTLEPTLATN